MDQASTRSLSFRLLGAVVGVLIVVLGILDVVSTNLVLAAGGRELNPIVSWTMEHLEAWWHMPKILIHVVAGLLVYHMLYTRFTAALAMMLVFLYAVVVHHNFTLIL